MTSFREARAAIQKLTNDGWLASGVTSPYVLLWDDVRGDKPPGFDANSQPIPYGNGTVRHTSSTTDTLGGEGLGKEEHRGEVRVQCFGPKGFGYTVAADLAQVVKRFYQRQRIGSSVDGWFFETTASEVPTEGPHAQVNVSAQFRWYESIP